MESIGFTFKMMLRSVAWTGVAVLSFAIFFSIALKVFDLLTPGIKEFDELKKGNMAVGIVFVALIITIGYLVGKVL